LNDRRIVSTGLVMAALVLISACAQDEAASSPASASLGSTPVPAETTTPASPEAQVLPGPPALDVAASPAAPAVTSSPAAPGPTAAALSGGLTGSFADSATEPGPAPPLADLVNADGSAFDLAAYSGSPTLLFFGYTHCPDVCPATIGEIFGVFEAAPRTKAIFVSVDPERDTPEWLAKWTEYMPESFDAVTGSPGAIRRAADGYGVRYARVETTSTAGYTMSHTADLFLIDGEGQLVRSFPFGTPAADVATAIAGLPAG
jgi:protein SCO1/2